MKKNKPAHWHLFLFPLLKEEFRLNTDREYPKDAGAAIHTGKPWKFSSLKHLFVISTVSALARYRGQGARQAERLKPWSCRAPLAISQSPYGILLKHFFSRIAFLLRGWPPWNWCKSGGIDVQQVETNRGYPEDAGVATHLGKPWKFPPLWRPLSFFSFCFGRGNPILIIWPKKLYHSPAQFENWKQISGWASSIMDMQSARIAGFDGNSISFPSSGGSKQIYTINPILIQ